MNNLEKIKKNASIVILTGAGVSAESGLETFRGAGGLWCGHRVEDVATPQAFMHDPDLVHDFYNMRRKGLLAPDIKPNKAHLALAELEQKWPDINGGKVLVITQNIDDLHERAGSKNLIHMHGEVLKAFCQFCSGGTGHKIDCHDDLSIEVTCESCQKSGGVRPDIVWFGEMPYHMDQIFQALTNCDLFLAIGTSGHVYPAAGFVAEAHNAGAATYEFNLEPSKNASLFHEQIYGPAGATIPKFVGKLLESPLET
jgi:NAD-dependent deacetylase